MLIVVVCSSVNLRSIKSALDNEEDDDESITNYSKDIKTDECYFRLQV